MADNVAITAGSGTTIAADDIGAGVLAQRVKPVWGPDGTGNDIDVATGKPLPIQVRSATGLIPIGEPTDAKSAATDTTSVSLVSVFKQISASIQSLVTAIGSTAWDLGPGSAGTRTQRVIVDTSQLATNKTGAGVLADGFQQVDAPTDGTIGVRLGSLTETAPASDTASSGGNGRLQRIAQRITSLIALFPAALGSGGGLKVDDIFGQYETVGASATAQVLGATGATGDYLAYVEVFPGTAGCGVVTILDNASTWGTFAGGGTTALPSLVPFRIDVGAYSTSGAWKITTGANVTAVGVGKFT
jgi:hypothetical protein